MLNKILRYIPPIVMILVLQVKFSMTEASTEWLTTFVTFFVAILLEAMPFVIIGSLLSGAIEVFVPKEKLAQLVPRNRLQAVLLFGLLGIVFPVCECGIVPVIRRLLQKGVPLSCGITYLLAAPIVQPIVLAATFVAFNGSWRIAGVRILGGYLVAVIVGLMASVVLDPKAHEHLAFDLEDSGDHEHEHHEHDHDCGHEHETPLTPMGKLDYVLKHAADEFLSTGYYLIFGAFLAAAMQTFLGQSVLTKLGNGPVTSAIVMMVLAFTLSLCSAADAFVAAAFTQFTIPARMAFLVMGPMVDIKLVAMYNGFLSRRATLFVFGSAAILAFAFSQALRLIGFH